MDWPPIAPPSEPETPELVHDHHPLALAREMEKRTKDPGVRAGFVMLLKRDESGQEFIWSDTVGVNQSDVVFALVRQAVKVILEEGDVEDIIRRILSE